MRIPSFSIALLFLAGFASLLHAKDDAKNAAAAHAVQLVLELSDGSRIVGTPSIDKLKITSKYADLEVQLSLMRAIEFKGTDRVAQLSLKNGDQMSGQLGATEIAMETVLGHVVIPMDKVNKVQVSPVGGDFVNSLGMEFIAVPGTKVLFGIWDTRVKDFEAFATATGYDATGGMKSLGNDASWGQHGATWKNPGFAQGATHPVVGVSWDDAKAFCKWLTGKERKEGKIGPDQGYRLPTDLEWSAAEGLPKESGDTPAERSGKIAGVYAWGNVLPPPKGAGNYAPSLKADDYEYTSPVGSFAANQYGLYDMGGNVWQWCEDWYDSTQKSRVLRGASWDNYEPDALLSSCRNADPPGYRDDHGGFRVVLTTESSR